MKTKMDIMVFGQLVEITHRQMISIETIEDTEVLLAKLYEQYPSLKEKSFVIAVDHKIINEKTVLHGDARIALLPPFSGG